MQLAGLVGQSSGRLYLAAFDVVVDEIRETDAERNQPTHDRNVVILQDRDMPSDVTILRILYAGRDLDAASIGEEKPGA